MTADNGPRHLLRCGTIVVLFGIEGALVWQHAEERLHGCCTIPRSLKGTLAVPTPAR